MIEIAPSILSADFSKLGDEVKQVKDGGADYVHFDVMDGNFVPNISIGLPVLQSLRKATDMLIDVHLMIDKPNRYVKQFCAAGADILTFHIESDREENIYAAIAEAHKLNKKAGITLRPGTDISAIIPLLKEVDLVLVMTVEPGFSGQRFMADQVQKIASLRRYIDDNGLDCKIEVDGGIDVDSAPLVKAAGADILVAGSAVFGKADRKAAIEAIRNS